MGKTNVISKVIANDLCIGCGVCIAVCPTNSLKIKLNDIGVYEPFIPEDNCDETGDCLNVCPFNPLPKDSVKTEDEISKKININGVSHKKSKVFGNYHGLHVGYAYNHRTAASSGGIATWVLKELLQRDYIDAVITTSEENNSNRYFKYTIITEKNELDLTTKTKYYPIEISEVLKLIKESTKRYAIVGLPCTIKALRLAQLLDAKQWTNVKFAISIFCGGLKSSFFTEYLSSKLSVKPHQIEKPYYRVKNEDSSAGDYAYSCVKKGENTSRILPMKEVGDMWGTGYFKPNACDFCEDLSGELADLSLGDAWIPPYNRDGKGHSLIITRTTLAEELINSGIDKGELKCNLLNPKQAFLSQEGNYNHRRKGLRYRLKWASKNGDIVPPKRTEKVLLENPLKAQIFRLRQKIQKESMLYWKQERNEIEPQFEEKIASTKKTLFLFTKIEHLFRRKYWLRKLKLR